MSLKNKLSVLLCRFPNLYILILKAMGSSNYEKLHYLSLVSRGNTVLELGANRGHFTKLFADIVGKRGKVYAFEPIPDTFQKLQSSLDGISQICLINKAVGLESGSCKMYVQMKSMGKRPWANTKVVLGKDHIEMFKNAKFQWCD